MPGSASFSRGLRLAALLDGAADVVARATQEQRISLETLRSWNGMSLGLSPWYRLRPYAVSIRRASLQLGLPPS